MNRIVFARMALAELECHKDAVRRIVGAATRYLDETQRQLDEIIEETDSAYRELEYELMKKEAVKCGS